MSTTHALAAGTQPAGDASWRELGLCRQTDPDLFSPEEGDSTAEARRICFACKVRKPCLDWALERGEPGVWGGTSASQRKAIRRSRTPIRRAAA
ncbi:WhiB family transcriptional regulator [Streptomyces sp. NPDC053541]|uniref:WhiB family transcriptional regulator n=1 Tax=Streptomyces sp. NPDC053541 TaxID=3365709 RepID=UPI0037CDF262